MMCHDRAMYRWIIFVVLAACGGSPKSAATPTSEPPSCVRVADHLIDLLSADAKGAPPEKIKQVHDEVRDHCVNDLWSAKLQRCMLDATKPNDLEKCNDLMTPAQQAAMAGPNDSGPPAAAAPAPGKDDDMAPGAPPVMQPAPPASSRSPKPKSGDPCEGGQ